jgi:hypothetical protein
LIPVGFTSFADGSNVEYSYLYLLPIPEKDIPHLIAADNFISGDYLSGYKEINLELPIELHTEGELKHMHQSNEPNIEICDAITRLWSDENKAVAAAVHDAMSTATAFE